MNHGGEANVGGKKGKKVQVMGRAREDVLHDMTLWANSHNGDTLTVTAWHALELLRDFDRRRTHFLALTLRLRPGNPPRTLYSLIDCEVLPRALIDEKHENPQGILRGDFTKAATGALALWDQQERDRVRYHGALGACIVVSMELPEGDERGVKQAFMEMPVMAYQPLGLFQVHKDGFMKRKLTRVPRAFWQKCLMNSLDGGIWSLYYQPYKDA